MECANYNAVVHTMKRLLLDYIISVLKLGMLRNVCIGLQINAKGRS